MMEVDMYVVLMEWLCMRLCVGSSMSMLSVVTHV